MSAFRLHRENIPSEQRCWTNWPRVDQSQLDPAERTVFSRRLGAVRSYLDGRKHSFIAREYGIERAEVGRLLARCIKPHRDGRIYGERALIPGTHCASYRRSKVVEVQPAHAHGGASGALTQLFDRFPDLRELVEDLFTRRIKRGEINESRIPVKGIHKRFIDKCRALGITDGYPFTTKWLGLRSLGKYLSHLLNEHRALAARMGEDTARRAEVSEGAGNGASISRPYQRVQFDGHRIDAFFTILLTHALGHAVPVTLPRLWVLVIKDVLSRAILGYCLSLNAEYSARDVMLCIRRAVQPWQPRSLGIPGLKYPEHGGFPSAVIPELKGALWDELEYDNAKANLGHGPRSFLTEVIQSSLNAGRIKAPERRAFLERFFKTLEENGFHRLASTTGSGPGDSRRRDPEKSALKYEMRLEHLEDLLEVLIAQYNGTPHTSLGYRTPLEVLKFHVAQGIPIRTLPEERRTDLALTGDKVIRTVRGQLKTGRSPYVELEGVVYRNEVLSRSHELIGQRLALRVNPDDMRCVTAFLESGAELGVLTALGPWGRTPHTLEARRAINSLRARKLFAYTEGQDPILAYQEHLANEGISKKRARAAYEKTKRKAETKSSKPTDGMDTADIAATATRHSVVLLAPRKTVTY